ncbi:hypothetical protein TRICI_005952 [Trichomonascus ciferrii]|uniref:Uncharacterized protein n=1 Tax=Trichomonascus ciferrii TaxID=44093 RepID=A0A642UN10_9ASCO|nr:hypothetical protein TRICI_005952 [Trichomonascus ciferrii]
MSTLRESVLQGLLEPQSSPLESFDREDVVEDERRQQLVRRLEHLKCLKTYWQEQVDRVSNANDDKTVDIQDQIESLLQSNDESVAEGNTIESTININNRELINRFTTLPDRTDGELTAMFHHLQFDETVNTKTVSRDVVLNEFNGCCREPSGKVLFEFHVWLYISPYKESVHGIRAEVSPWTRRELNELISRACKSKDILLLMHGLAQYADMALRRLRVFQKLSKNYTLSDELWKRSPNVVFEPTNHIQMILRWPIIVDNQGECISIPTIELNPPAELLEHDKTGVFTNYKRIFHHILQLKGVYKATLIIYDLIS